ncbi:hypothetical protein PanWU01x14_156820 [Parasponia andersonii]|uniref:Uncharacterized protein n=1 Tax=Parasponia andersonii TaxID=3476 RepID=A0A2P5CFH6_PARAD|nr:hypothetical protein PanWU01x14_156820 [Parasponia andersonii]
MQDPSTFGLPIQVEENLFPLNPDEGSVKDNTHLSVVGKILSTKILCPKVVHRIRILYRLRKLVSPFTTYSTSALTMKLTKDGSWIEDLDV